MATLRLLLAAALALTPAARPYAQADDDGDAVTQMVSEVTSASVECRGVGLRIMAAEVSGARFVCQINGAPASDSSFAVEAVSTADQTHTMVPLCSGNLASGSGAC